MFGDVLKGLREQSGVSQKELSKILHVSQQTIASWEVNRTTPSLELLNDVADYFDVTIDYLLGRENSLVREVNVSRGKDKAEEEIDPLLIEQYLRLDEVDKAKVSAYIDGLLEAEKYIRQEKLA